ncbi:OLC1v1016523C1 [Oldenlandia corymbosa var. corymbosa]|uniref:OLC1v1016523C1 n=1 Tax=Oldenlandia corymbosa var. corymbosa TaxID=529605 RepID=A0AAV1E7I9_OLDCO|nr:OLC1v1016523C1 [Oldenlandia corymbosa var. corymbosa]
MAAAIYCWVCKKSTEVRFDSSAGDTVCDQCGLLLESRSIDDEKYQGRPFIERSGNGGSGGGGGGGSDRVDRAFATIAAMSSRLNLDDKISNRAKGLYKKLLEQKLCKGRNQDALMAACLYISCRLEKSPRTYREISPVANGATDTQIGNQEQYIVQQFGIDLGQIRATDFIRRFCSTIGLENHAINAATEAAEKTEQFDIRRSPPSIAAALGYLVSQLSDDTDNKQKKPLLEDVAVITKVSERTIRNCCNDLVPHLSNMIPSWYAKENRILKFCAALDL